jgi:HEAT repeat protein
VRILGVIKRIDPKIQLALSEGLKDPSPYVRREAASALEEVKPTDPKIHLALSEVLRDPEYHVRRVAARALGAIKPTDPHIHLALVEALEDPNSDVRDSAARALQAIKPTDLQTHQALAELLQSDKEVRPNAAQVLQSIFTSSLDLSEQKQTQFSRCLETINSAPISDKKRDEILELLKLIEK